MLKINVASLELVKVPVSARVAGVPHNPTGDAVQMAFVPFSVEAPAPTAWKAASWQTDSGVYLACCLVGPGGTVALARGRYKIFVRITDSPEIPVKPSPTTLQVI